MRLQDLVPEIAGYPRRKEFPEIREVGRKLAIYIRHNIGKGIIKKWGVDKIHDKSIVRLYLSLLHHDPNGSNYLQPVTQLIRASQRFNAPFRMFGDGNLICVEFEVNYETKTI